jgi:hypothetical protein
MNGLEPHHRPRPLTAERRDAAIALLQSWLDADDDEIQDQRETFDALRKGIDEERARLGMRLIFSE